MTSPRPSPLMPGALPAAWLAVCAGPALAGPSVPELVEVADVTSLSASPDGRRVVFRVDRASIAHNSYSLDWYAADLETGVVRRIADGGGQIEGGAEALAADSPVWSPDQRSVFYRALVDGAVGIWRAEVDGSGRQPVVVTDADVESMTAGPEEGTLTYVLGPSREAIERAERREYDEGILVDGSVDLHQNLYRGGWVNGRLASQRMVGQWYTRAGLLWREPRRRYRLDLRSLGTAALGPAGAPSIEPLGAAALDPAVELKTPGRPAVRIHRQGNLPMLEIELGDGAHACDQAACRSGQIASAAWRPGTDELAFTTRDGHFSQAIHLWDVNRDTVRTVVRGDGLVSGSRDPSRPCAFTRDVAVCVTAGAVSPPRVERIELASGRRTVLFDPNALLRQRETAPVEQLTVPLADGREVSATVLLPLAMPAPAPLFVSYYYCPGYLRGGTGDAFPFAPLVDAGFAVACLNMVPGDKSDIVAGYRAGLASVEALVELLVRRGVVDPARVGMGGFSAGGEVAMWVAMNSDLLAASAVATSQYSPSDYWSNALPGRDFAEVLRAFLGLGSPDETPERWRLVSPALNVERITAPLLMQVPENEARAQAELYSRLARTRTPVELFAFPDENHLLFQPRHRLAAYERGLDWFRYWLQDYADPDPAKAGQYRRWDALRQAQASSERSQTSAEARSRSRR